MTQNTQDKNVRFMFLRNANQNPVGVLLMQRNKETKQVKFAVALASPKDSFNKELGLKIAGGRLAKKPVVLETTETTFHAITKQVMSKLLEVDSSPMAQLAAKTWLDKASDKQKVNHFVKYGFCLPQDTLARMNHHPLVEDSEIVCVGDVK